MSKKIKISIVSAIVLVCVTLTGFAYTRLGSWLVVSDPLPASLDVVFTFAGDTERMNYSKQLFAKFPGTLWVISYPGKNITVPLYKEGLDTSRILVVDTCANTQSEASCIFDMANRLASGNAVGFAGKHIQVKDMTPQRRLSVGLVSSPYHMRRIKVLMASKRLEKQVALVYCAVPFVQTVCSKRDYETWWKNSALAPVVRSEVKKILYHLGSNFRG